MENNHTSAKDVRSLKTPKSRSHKWQNGSILVIGGSHRYHGAPLFTIHTAARFVDIVHFASPENYQKLLPDLRKKIFEFIPVFDKELSTYAQHVDVVIAGPGFEVTKRNALLLKRLMKQFPQKKFVFDAGAIRMVPLEMLTQNHILTPNQREFEDIFRIKPTPASTVKMANAFTTTILAKGPVSFIASGKRFAKNRTGNAGLTKGGTGDILAGLVASFFTKNDPFLSSKAAAFLLGKTGDALHSERNFAYSASDVMARIPIIFNKYKRS